MQAPPIPGGYGRTVTKDGITYDNRWVVPYNPALLLEFQCHINVEICSSVKSVKYVHKYVHKGDARAQVEISRHGTTATSSSNSSDAPVDEVKEYLDGR